MKSYRFPEVWADAYLSAFAVASGLHLVTFDRGFSKLPLVEVSVLPEHNVP